MRKIIYEFFMAIAHMFYKPKTIQETNNMSELSKKLRYQTDSGTSGAITLYSTQAEAGDNYINLQVDNVNAYAALGSKSDPMASHMRVQKSNTTYAILKEKLEGLVLTDFYYTMSSVYPDTYKTMTQISDKLNTSNVTRMNNMFRGCESLTTIPPLDTSNVTNMGHMFWKCRSITTIPPLDTSNVTNMNDMFWDCNAITSIPQLNTSKVTNLSETFWKCNSLTSVPPLDTSNATNLYAMFWGCKSLTTIPQLDTSKATNVGRLFSETSITAIDWIDLSNATTVQAMFDGCVNLKSIPQLNISKATDSHQMFKNCKSLTSIPELNTSNVVSMRNMFEGCTSLPSTFPWVINMEKVDTTSINGYQNMFKGSSVTKVRVKRAAKDLDANKMKSGGITIEYV